MPQQQFIAKLLDMEHMNFLGVEQSQDTLILKVEMKRRDCSCPACQTLTNQVHDYRFQKVKDSPLQGRPLIWLYRKRRYRCPHCGKRFSEANYLLPKGHRITNRLALLATSMLKEKRSRKDIAREVFVSPSTIGRWLQLLEYGKPRKLPKVLSIDEFRGNTEYGKFQCILTAPTEKRIVDILPTYRETDIHHYLWPFPNRKEVNYFITDMKKEYVALAKNLLPNATIVIDRFHVVRYCTWALENVRKRVQKKLLPEQRKYFKRSRKLLLSHLSKLSPQNMEAVNRMLLVDRDLREAYLLKEVFYRFMASADPQEAKRRLQEFRLHAAVADIPEFQPCLTMLQNWQPYILNAFACPYSNGFTEGCNNTIKVLKRIAYGYRNFHNFRRRILITLNAKEPSAKPQMAPSSSSLFFYPND